MLPIRPQLRATAAQRHHALHRASPAGIDIIERLHGRTTGAVADDEFSKSEEDEPGLFDGGVLSCPFVAAKAWCEHQLRRAVDHA